MRQRTHDRTPWAARVAGMLGRIGVVAGIAAGARAAGAPAQAIAPGAPLGPAFPIGGPKTTTWREEVLTKAQELSGLASWIAAHPNRAHPVGNLPQAIANELETARLTASGGDRSAGIARRNVLRRVLAWLSRVLSGLNGASFERALGNLDAAEVNLLRLAPDEYIRGQFPSLQSHVNRYLAKDDPRRTAVDALIAADDPAAPLVGRGALISAFHAANTQRRRDLVRLRSFRNLLAGGAATLFALAVLVAFLGARHRSWMPMCFFPQEQSRFVCPLGEMAVSNPGAADVDNLIAATASPDDILVVELVGLIAASLAGAVALRGMRGTSTPYGVPVALILLKLPAGALTAVLGILFMRGGFVPGLTALDTSAQIVAWAIIFGYAQQVFTRLVDDQGQTLLDGVAGRGPAGDRDTKSG